jgi:hypothetical protein
VGRGAAPVAGDVPDATVARQLSARPPRMRTPPSLSTPASNIATVTVATVSGASRGPSQCPPRRPSVPLLGRKRHVRGAFLHRPPDEGRDTSGGTPAREER